MNEDGQVYFDNEEKLPKEDVKRLANALFEEEMKRKHWSPSQPSTEREDYFDEDVVSEVEKAVKEPKQKVLVLINDRAAALRIIDKLKPSGAHFNRHRWQLRYPNDSEVVFASRPNHVRGMRVDRVIDHYSADDRLWTEGALCLRG